MSTLLILLSTLNLLSVVFLATWTTVLLIVLGVVIVIFIVLIILGNKMQKRQEQTEANIMNGAQTVSMLIIDKKRMKMKEAGFPDVVLQGTPKYLRGTKVPVVKAKVGPQVHSLMCDPKIFDNIPVKKEVKATINGIYIIKVQGLRGPLEAPAEKVGFFKRLLKKAQKKVDEANKTSQPKTKKK